MSAGRCLRKVVAMYTIVAWWYTLHSIVYNRDTLADSRRVFHVVQISFLPGMYAFWTPMPLHPSWHTWTVTGLDVILDFWYGRGDCPLSYYRMYASRGIGSAHESELDLIQFC